jgi:thymidylate synthase
LPTLHIKRDVSSIFDFRYDDFEVVGYDPDPAIPAPVAV